MFRVFAITAALSVTAKMEPAAYTLNECRDNLRRVISQRESRHRTIELKNKKALQEWQRTDHSSPKPKAEAAPGMVFTTLKNLANESIEWPEEYKEHVIDAICQSKSAPPAAADTPRAYSMYDPTWDDEISAKVSAFKTKIFEPIINALRHTRTTQKKVFTTPEKYNLPYLKARLEFPDEALQRQQTVHNCLAILNFSPDELQQLNILKLTAIAVLTAINNEVKKLVEGDIEKAMVVAEKWKNYQEWDVFCTDVEKKNFEETNTACVEAKTPVPEKKTWFPRTHGEKGLQEASQNHSFLVSLSQEHLEDTPKADVAKLLDSLESASLELCGRGLKRRQLEAGDEGLASFQRAHDGTGVEEMTVRNRACESVARKWTPEEKAAAPFEYYPVSEALKLVDSTNLKTLQNRLDQEECMAGLAGIFTNDLFSELDVDSRVYQHILTRNFHAESQKRAYNDEVLEDILADACAGKGKKHVLFEYKRNAEDNKALEKDEAGEPLEEPDTADYLLIEEKEYNEYGLRVIQQNDLSKHVKSWDTAYTAHKQIFAFHEGSKNMKEGLENVDVSEITRAFKDAEVDEARRAKIIADLKTASKKQGKTAAQNLQEICDVLKAERFNRKKDKRMAENANNICTPLLKKIDEMNTQKIDEMVEKSKDDKTGYFNRDAALGALYHEVKVLIKFGEDKTIELTDEQIASLKQRINLSDPESVMSKLIKENRESNMLYIILIACFGGLFFVTLLGCLVCVCCIGGEKGVPEDLPYEDDEEMLEESEEYEE